MAYTVCHARLELQARFILMTSPRHQYDMVVFGNIYVIGIGALQTVYAMFHHIFNDIVTKQKLFPQTN